MKLVYFVDQVPGEPVREPEQSQNNYNLLKRLLLLPLLKNGHLQILSVSNEQVQTAANNLKYASACACDCTWWPSVNCRCCLSRGPLAVFQKGLSLADRDLNSLAELPGYV